MRRCVACLLLSSSIPLSGAAQPLLPDALKQLQSRDWTKRAEAVDRFTETPEWLRSSAAKRGLLGLLDHENRGDGRPGSGFGVTGDERHAEYYSRVLGLVDSFVDSSDVAGVAILVHSVYNPDSTFAVKLASYGETVVQPLLALSRREDAGRDLVQRSDAHCVLGFVLKAHRQGTSLHPLSNQSARIVEERLHAGLRDRQSVVRVGAIHGVISAADIDVLPVLEQLARTDPKATRTDDGKTRYLVREEAARAIAALQSKQ
jgi:hypothetical protein